MIYNQTKSQKHRFVCRRRHFYYELRNYAKKMLILYQPQLLSIVPHTQFFGFVTHVLGPRVWLSALFGFDERSLMSTVYMHSLIVISINCSIRCTKISLRTKRNWLILVRHRFCIFFLLHLFVIIFLHRTGSNSAKSMWVWFFSPLNQQLTSIIFLSFSAGTPWAMEFTSIIRVANSYLSTCHLPYNESSHCIFLYHINSLIWHMVILGPYPYIILMKF